jgi:hypothetical protein
VAGLARPLAIVLLAGTALLGVGAAVHPMLVGDAASQLQTIAATPYWRALHLGMLAGSGLVIAGIWVRLVTDRGASAGLIAALAIVTAGMSLNALDTAFMAGSGTRMAAQFASGHAEMQSIFAATHPIGLMAARFGNFVIALGATALGWVEWRDETRPRWVAWLAWLAAAGGFVGVLFFDESSRLVLGAVALLSGWEVATAALALRAPRPSTLVRRRAAP